LETRLRVVSRESTPGKPTTWRCSLEEKAQAVRLMRTAPVTAEMILNYVSEHELGLPRSY